MRSILITLFLSVFVAFAVIAEESESVIEEAPFNLEEVESLIAKKDWAEALMRLPSVPPADRTARWESIVERAALGQLKSIAVESPSNGATVAEDLIKNYPSLQRSAAFNEESRKIFFKGFTACYEDEGVDKNKCGAQLKEYVETNKNPETALMAGELVAKLHGLSQAAPFFKSAVTPVSKKACENETVKKSALSALGSNRVEWVAPARELIGKSCWNSMKTELVRALGRQPAAAFIDEACPLLKQNQVSTPAIQKICKKPPSKK